MSPKRKARTLYNLIMNNDYEEDVADPNSQDKPSEIKLEQTEEQLKMMIAFKNKDHDYRKPYRCSFCNKSYLMSSSLERHMPFHFGPKPYRCPKCKKQFEHSNDLLKHQKIHSRRFACSHCPQIFTAAVSLENHNKTHLGHHKYFQCRHCNKKFPTRKILMLHRLVHANSSRIFKCSICGKVFGNPSSVRSHIKDVHKKRYPHSCKMCGLALSESSHLLEHVKVHLRK